MKTYQKILLGLASLAALLGLGFSQNAIGAVLNSNQVGTNPVAGSVLQTNGATSTWVATSTLGIGGGSGVVGPSTSTYVSYFNTSSTITGSSTFTFATTSYNTSTIQLSVIAFESIANADQFPGSDMDAQIQNAYNALPSNGGQVFVPAGTFNVSSSIVIGTAGKVLNLMCAAGGGLYLNGGTTLHWTPTNGTVQFTYNVQNYVSAGTGITNCRFLGPAGAGGSGSSNVTSSIAIVTGGTNGAFGFALNNVSVSGYGTDLEVATNTAFLNITNSILQKAGQVLWAPQVGGGGENNRVTNSVLADGNNGNGSIAQYCVNIQLSGNTEWTFQGDSFDDCQEYSNQYGGTLNVIKNTDNHYEDPNYAATGAYDFIQGISGQAGSFVIDDVGNDFQQDANSGLPNEYVTSGGTFLSTDDNLALEGGNGAVPVSKFVTAQDSNDVTNIQGLTQNYGNTSASAAVTYNVGTNPYAPNGLYYGSTLIYYQSTSTTQFGNKVVILSNDLEDASGNKYSTSTSSGISGLTAGYLPMASGTTALANSNAYQNNNSTPSSTTYSIPLFVTSSSISNSGGISSITSTITGVASNSFLIITFGYSNAPSTTVVTDSNGTPTFMASTTWHGTSSHDWVYYEANAAAGTHAINVSHTGVGTIFNALQVSDFSGIATSSPLDTFRLGTSTPVGSNQTITSGNMVQATNNEMAFGFGDTAGSGLTAGSGWQMRINGVTEDNAATGTQFTGGQNVATTFISSTGGVDTLVYGALFFDSVSSSIPFVPATNDISINTTSDLATFGINGTFRVNSTSTFLGNVSTTIATGFVYSNSLGILTNTSTPQAAILRGVSNTLGGTLLSGVGTCIEATGTVTGILPSMSINASPATTTDIGDGLAIRAWASAANQATVELCSLLATITPVATTYQFSAIP